MGTDFVVDEIADVLETRLNRAWAVRAAAGLVGEVPRLSCDFRRMRSRDIQDDGDVRLLDAVRLLGVVQPENLDEPLDTPEVAPSNVVDSALTLSRLSSRTFA